MKIGLKIKKEEKNQIVKVIPFEKYYLIYFLNLLIIRKIIF
jgi:hypothetical protein